VHLSTPVKTALSNKLVSGYLESSKPAKGIDAWEQVAIYVIHFLFLTTIDYSRVGQNLTKVWKYYL
jgi:hypothetical protein